MPRRGFRLAFFHLPRASGATGPPVFGRTRMHLSSHNSTIRKSLTFVTSSGGSLIESSRSRT